jgi:large-conductance mechanosensitive channel
MWGSILQAVIDFLIIGLTMFLVLRIFAQLSKRAAEIREDLKKKLNAEQAEKEAAEKKKKEEEERAQALAAEEAARIEAERIAAEQERLAEEHRLAEEQKREQLALLREIRDLLKTEQ